MNLKDLYKLQRKYLSDTTYIELLDKHTSYMTYIDLECLIDDFKQKIIKSKIISMSKINMINNSMEVQLDFCDDPDHKECIIKEKPFYEIKNLD